MHSHKKKLVPPHRPVCKLAVMPVNEEASRSLVADDNASGRDDAVVVEMPASDEDSECENDEVVAWPGNKRACMALGGVGAMAGMFGLGQYLWPDSADTDLPEDAPDVLDMLNQSMTSPAESRNGTSSQMVDAISGKWARSFGLPGKGLLLVQVASGLLAPGALQMFRLLQTEAARSSLPTNTSGNLLSASSSIDAARQMAYQAAGNMTDDNAYDGVWDAHDAEMIKEMARIDMLVIRDLGFLFDAEGERVVERKRRGAVASGRRHVDDREIEGKVRHVFKGGDLSKDFLQLGQRLIDRVEADEDVAAAAPGERPVLFYVAALELVIEDLKSHVKNNEINSTYHFLYSRLMLLRAIEEWFSSHRTAEQVERYNQRLRAENEAFLKLQRLRPEQDEVDVFLKSKHAYWYEKGVRSTEKIAIHRKGEMLVFSLSDMFEQQHVDADGNSPMGKYTFLFDSSGLVYGQKSGEIFSSIRNNQFSQFKQDPIYQDYIQQRANALFQEALGAPQIDLLYLDRNALVKSVQDSLARMPLLATASGNNDLGQAVGNLSTIQRHWNVTETATNVYAQSLLGTFDLQLFDGMDIEQILSSDYRYSYIDDDSEKLYDTAKLPELLSQDTCSENIEIARRRDVRVDYPAEFSVDLTTALSDTRQQVGRFWTKAQDELVSSQVRLDLEKKMPSLFARIVKKRDESCQLIGMSRENCNFGNKVVFSFELLGYKPIEKTLTIGQIMLGELRKFDAEYSARTRQIIAFPKNDATAEEKAKFIRFLKYVNNQDMQEQIIDSVEQLKNDREVKQLFNQYVMGLTSKIPGKHVETSELASSPFLRIIKTRIPTASGAVEWKSYVLSILTGDIYPFDNNFYAINAMQRNSSLIANLDAHFVIGERKEYDRKLRTEGNLEQHFERVLQHQKANVDKLFMSIAESHFFGVLELVSDLGSYVIEALVPNPLFNAVLSAAISSGAKAAQGFILTEERARLNQVALRNFIKSIAGSISGPASAKVSRQLLRSEAEKISKDFSQLFKNGKGRLISEKIGEKGASYSLDGLVDWAVDYFIGKVPDTVWGEVPDAMLGMGKIIDLTGSFQLYKTLSANASSQSVSAD